MLRKLGQRLSIVLPTLIIALFATALPAFADDRPDGAELAGAWAMLVVIGGAFILACLGIYWSWKNGELNEPEEIKYTMLDMCDDEVDYWSQDEDDGGDLNLLEPSGPLYPSGSEMIPTEEPEKVTVN